MPFGSGHLQKGFFWSNRSVVDEDVYAVELLKYHLPNPSNVVSLPDITHCDLGAHAMAPGLFGDALHSLLRVTGPLLGAIGEAFVYPESDLADVAAFLDGQLQAH